MVSTPVLHLLTLFSPSNSHTVSWPRSGMTPGCCLSRAAPLCPLVDTLALGLTSVRTPGSPLRHGQFPQVGRGRKALCNCTSPPVSGCVLGDRELGRTQSSGRPSNEEGSGPGRPLEPFLGRWSAMKALEAPLDEPQVSESLDSAAAEQGGAG